MTDSIELDLLKDYSVRRGPVGLNTALRSVFTPAKKAIKEMKGCEQRANEALRELEKNMMLMSMGDYSLYDTSLKDLEDGRNAINQVSIALEKGPLPNFGKKYELFKLCEVYRQDTIGLEIMSQTTSDAINRRKARQDMADRARGDQTASAATGQPASAHPSHSHSDIEREILIGRRESLDNQRNTTEPADYEGSEPPTPKAFYDENNVKRLINSVIHRATHDYTSLHALEWHPDDKPAFERSVYDIADFLGRVSRQKSVYWLWQDRESGRANVLRYVAHVCHRQKALASAFFFPEPHSNSKAPTISFRKGLAPTLALELTGYIPCLNTKLKRICATRGESVFNRAITSQIDALIVKPCVELIEANHRQLRQRPFLVIINALDRCSTVDGLELMEAIENCIEHLPMCFLISSAREPWVEEKFHSWNARHVSHQGIYK